MSALTPDALQDQNSIPLMPFPITLTEKASEMVQEALKDEPDGAGVLRIGVVGGGCSGLQYLLDFSPPPVEDDFISEQHNVRVCIDPFSAAHLAGTTIDYVDNLSGTGFRFENPNVIRSCGCGSSFQT